MPWEMVILAFALSTDSFCLSLALACQGLNKLKIWLFTLLVGLLHVLLPLLGMYLGQSSQRILGTWAPSLGALALILMGVKVIYDGLKRKKNCEKIYVPNCMYLLFLTLAVSIDSLVAGFGLGTLGFQLFKASLIFGLTAAILTRLAFSLAKYLGRYVKEFDYFAGGVLILLGIRGLF